VKVYSPNTPVWVVIVKLAVEGSVGKVVRLTGEIVGASFPEGNTSVRVT
jgi:hypothetical protein